MTERLVDDTSLGADTETPGEPLNNRRDLIRKIALAGAGAAAGAAVLANRADALDGAAINAAADNTATLPTSVIDSAITALPSPGPSFLTVAEKKPGTTLPPAAADPLNIFPAAIGGYGIANIKNGVHGSTKAIDGFGVVAANAAAPDAAKAAPLALAVGAFGSQIKFLTPGEVATAAGVTPVPAKVVGPSLGTHGPGELYVDDNHDLWFSVPGATATAPVKWLRLAGAATAGSFVALPSPVRVYDSRLPSPSPLVTGQERSITVTTGPANIPVIPIGASAGAFNLTVTDTLQSGFLAIFSDDVSFANTSNINWKADAQDIANFAISAVSATGKVRIRAGGPGSTNFALDVAGYYL